MASWPDSVLGFRTEGNGVLNAYSRCLRLLSGLSSGPPMAWLMDRVRTHVHADLASRLALDPLVMAMRERIEGADENTASVLRQLCSSHSVSGYGDPIRNAMEGIGRGLPVEVVLQNVMAEEYRITEVWSDALELPAAVTMPFAASRRLLPVDRQTAATLFSDDSMKKVVPLFSIRHGMGWNAPGCDCPEWVADLVPPAPLVWQFEVAARDKAAPLAVFHGQVQDLPAWRTPWVVPFAVQHELLRECVVRFVPSGACIFEKQGEETIMPSSFHSMVVPPSMVANTVVTTGVPEFCGALGTYQTSEVGLAFPSVLGADMPWRFFVGLARDEALFRQYDEEQNAAAGGPGVQDETNYDEKIVSKKARKRKQQSQHHAAEVAKKAKGDGGSSSSRLEHVTGPAQGEVIGGSAGRHGGVAQVSHGRHIFLAAKTKSAPKAAVETFVASGSHGRRGRSTSPGPRTVGRPASPSRSPMPHQRAAIARSRTIPSERADARVVMFPPDWQCPTPECINHVKMVFAKKEKCPICGASRPTTSTGTSRTERMSGHDFRRFHPVSRDVSRGRDTRDDRDYTVRSSVELHECGDTPPGLRSVFFRVVSRCRLE